jgi:hypothetical protein
MDHEDVAFKKVYLYLEVLRINVRFGDVMHETRPDRKGKAVLQIIEHLVEQLVYSIVPSVE